MPPHLPCPNGRARRCVIEAFTFLRVGADIERIKVLPLVVGSTSLTPPDDEQLGAAMDAARTAFLTFDVRRAQCYAADQNHLLAAVESGFESLDEFNRVCSHAMVSSLAQAEERANLSKRRSRCSLPRQTRA